MFVISTLLVFNKVLRFFQFPYIVIIRAYFYQ